jgi:hypothetical protein
MNMSIISSAQVPRDQYIERSADSQIRRIINDMARPGYVLVARQMGKTNLLLHAKDVLQTPKEIFVYVDFSTLSDYSEQECLNHLIDTAIEINFELFEDAEHKISELRNKEGYNVAKAFVRELRILLAYADKIVFILDEIDALTRKSYSDRIFSLIRGHYYACANFPELKRATFILSGVIEPKDIIKDPNISPFNIGEKIYLSDFTWEEFLSLSQNSSYLSLLPEELIGRLYYWCGGQPRMAWDICSAAEHFEVSSIDEIDSMVSTLYLTKFDKAPIDSIRDKVKSDVELRGAVIQLIIGKGDTLQPELKSKLYLSGIINYKSTSPQFKNAIMRESLSYEWLLSLSSNNNREYLSAAEKCINIEKDYKSAINYLCAYINDRTNSISDTRNDEMGRAYYLLALAYQRNFNPEESLSQLENLADIKIGDSYYEKVLLLKACDYIALSEFNKAEFILKQLISIADQIDQKTVLMSKLYLASVLMEQKNEGNLEDSKGILLKLLRDDSEELQKCQLLSVLMYNLSLVEAEKGNDRECVKHIDTALLSAQPNEKPRLLYFKLMHSDDKIQCADELYNSLKEIKSKPETESLDNPLAFDMPVACLIIAEFMLNYKNYDVTRYLRQFFYDSKESAVIFIYLMLDQLGVDIAVDFFQLINHLTNTSEWNFQVSELINLSIIEIKKFNTTHISKKVRNIVKKGRESLPSDIQTLYMQLISRNLKLRKIKETEIFIEEYREVQSRILNKNFMHSIFIDYMECSQNHRSGKYAKLEQNATKLYNTLTRLDYTKFKDGKRIRIEDISMIKTNIEIILRGLVAKKKQLKIIDCNRERLGRNSKIRVHYSYDGHEVIGKYKQLKKDIDLGLCHIIEDNIE